MPETETWISTRTLIARTRKADPDADTSELLDTMRRQKAEADILRIANKVGLTTAERQRIAFALIGGDVE